MKEILSFEKYKQISIEIKKRMQENKNEEALALCTEENCQNDIVIQSQKIAILFKLKEQKEIIIKECEKAYERWEDEGFIRSKLTATSQLIQEFINQGLYEEALALCTEENCQNNIAIQRQKITILFKLKEQKEIIIKECEKAYERWEDERFIHSKLTATSQLIQELINQGLYEEALALCAEENCQNNIVIQNQKYTIQHCLNLAEKPIFTVIEKQQMNTILFENPKNNILSKIYYDTLDIEELNHLEIDSWEKFILYIAYYEKHNKQKGLQFLKQNLFQIEATPEQRKIINVLKQRLSNKKNVIFDCGIYCEILGCSIDFQEAFENKNDDIFGKTSVIKQEEIKENEQLKMNLECEQKFITVEEKKKSGYATTLKEFQPKVETMKQILIKDVFSIELLEIKKYIYIEMNWGANKQGAIRVWDTLACLEEKEASDKAAYKKMLRIIEICNENHVVQLNMKRIRKLSKKNLEDND